MIKWRPSGGTDYTNDDQLMAPGPWTARIKVQAIVGESKPLKTRG